MPKMAASSIDCVMGEGGHGSMSAPEAKRPAEHELYKTVAADAWLDAGRVVIGWVQRSADRANGSTSTADHHAHTHASNGNTSTADHHTHTSASNGDAHCSSNPHARAFNGRNRHFCSR